MAVGTPVDLAPGARPTFGVDAENISVRKIDLATARNKERSEFGASGAIWAISASSPLANIDLRFNEQNDPINFRSGQSLEGVRFSRVYLSNEAQADESITFLTVRDLAGRIDFGNPAPKSWRASHTTVPAPNLATTLVSPFNPKKRRVICTPNTAFTGWIIGFSTPLGLADGMPMQLSNIVPQTYTFDTFSAVYVFQQAGANRFFSVIEFFED